MIELRIAATVFVLIYALFSSVAGNAPTFWTPSGYLTSSLPPWTNRNQQTAPIASYSTIAATCDKNSTKDKTVSIAGYDKEILEIIEELQKISKCLHHKTIAVNFYMINKGRYFHMDTVWTDLEVLEKTLNNYNHYFCLNKGYFNQDQRGDNDNSFYLNNLIMLPNSNDLKYILNLGKCKKVKELDDIIEDTDDKVKIYIINIDDDLEVDASESKDDENINDETTKMCNDLNERECLCIINNKSVNILNDDKLSPSIEDVPYTREKEQNENLQEVKETQLCKTHFNNKAIHFQNNEEIPQINEPVINENIIFHDHLTQGNSEPSEKNNGTLIEIEPLVFSQKVQSCNESGTLNTSSTFNKSNDGIVPFDTKFHLQTNPKSESLITNKVKDKMTDNIVNTLTHSNEHTIPFIHKEPTQEYYVNNNLIPSINKPNIPSWLNNLSIYNMTKPNSQLIHQKNHIQKKPYHFQMRPETKSVFSAVPRWPIYLVPNYNYYLNSHGVNSNYIPYLHHISAEKSNSVPNSSQNIQFAKTAKYPGYSCIYDTAHFPSLKSQKIFRKPDSSTIPLASTVEAYAACRKMNKESSLSHHLSPTLNWKTRPYTEKGPKLTNNLKVKLPNFTKFQPTEYKKCIPLNSFGKTTLPYANKGQEKILSSTNYVIPYSGIPKESKTKESSPCTCLMNKYPGLHNYFVPVFREQEKPMTYPVRVSTKICPLHYVPNSHKNSKSIGVDIHKNNPCVETPSFIPDSSMVKLIPEVPSKAKNEIMQFWPNYFTPISIPGPLNLRNDPVLFFPSKKNYIVPEKNGSLATYTPLTSKNATTISLAQPCDGTRVQKINVKSTIMKPERKNILNLKNNLGIPGVPIFNKIVPVKPLANSSTKNLLESNHLRPIYEVQPRPCNKTSENFKTCHTFGEPKTFNIPNFNITTTAPVIGFYEQVPHVLITTKPYSNQPLQPYIFSTYPLTKFQTSQVNRKNHLKESNVTLETSPVEAFRNMDSKILPKYCPTKILSDPCKDEALIMKKIPYVTLPMKTNNPQLIRFPHLSNVGENMQKYPKPCINISKKIRSKSPNANTKIPIHLKTEPTEDFSENVLYMPTNLSPMSHKLKPFDKENLFTNISDDETPKLITSSQSNPLEPKKDKEKYPIGSETSYWLPHYDVKTKKPCSKILPKKFSYSDSNSLPPGQFQIHHVEPITYLKKPFKMGDETKEFNLTYHLLEPPVKLPLTKIKFTDINKLVPYKTNYLTPFNKNLFSNLNKADHKTNIFNITPSYKHNIKPYNFVLAEGNSKPFSFAPFTIVPKSNTSAHVEPLVKCNEKNTSFIDTKSKPCSNIEIMNTHKSPTINPKSSNKSDKSWSKYLTPSIKQKPYTVAESKIPSILNTIVPVYKEMNKPYFKTLQPCANLQLLNSYPHSYKHPYSNIIQKYPNLLSGHIPHWQYNKLPLYFEKTKPRIEQNTNIQTKNQNDLSQNILLNKLAPIFADYVPCPEVGERLTTPTIINIAAKGPFNSFYQTTQSPRNLPDSVNTPIISKLEPIDNNKKEAYTESKISNTHFITKIPKITENLASVANNLNLSHLLSKLTPDYGKNEVPDHIPYEKYLDIHSGRPYFSAPPLPENSILSLNYPSNIPIKKFSTQPKNICTSTNLSYNHNSHKLPYPSILNKDTAVHLKTLVLNTPTKLLSPYQPCNTAFNNLPMGVKSNYMVLLPDSTDFSSTAPNFTRLTEIPFETKLRDKILRHYQPTLIRPNLDNRNGVKIISPEQRENWYSKPIVRKTIPLNFYPFSTLGKPVNNKDKTPLSNIIDQQNNIKLSIPLHQFTKHVPFWPKSRMSHGNLTKLPLYSPIEPLTKEKLTTLLSPNILREPQSKQSGLSVMTRPKKPMILLNSNKFASSKSSACETKVQPMETNRKSSLQLSPHRVVPIIIPEKSSTPSEPGRNSEIQWLNSKPLVHIPKVFTDKTEIIDRPIPTTINENKTIAATSTAKPHILLIPNLFTGLPSGTISKQTKTLASTHSPETPILNRNILKTHPDQISPTPGPNDQTKFNILSKIDNLVPLNTFNLKSHAPSLSPNTVILSFPNVISNVPNKKQTIRPPLATPSSTLSVPIKVDNSVPADTLNFSYFVPQSNLKAINSRTNANIPLLNKNLFSAKPIFTWSDRRHEIKLPFEPKNTYSILPKNKFSKLIIDSLKPQFFSKTLWPINKYELLKPNKVFENSNSKSRISTDQHKKLAPAKKYKLISFGMNKPNVLELPNPLLQYLNPTQANVRHINLIQDPILNAHGDYFPTTLAKPKTVIDADKSKLHKFIDKLNDNIKKIINNDNDAKVVLFNDEKEITIPLTEIGIAKYTPNTSEKCHIIETKNPYIFLKAWKSKLKLVKVKISLETECFDSVNFVPVVMWNLPQKYVQKTAEEVITKLYAKPIVVQGVYSLDNAYAVVNGDFKFSNNRVVYVLWPTFGGKFDVS